MSLSPPRLFLEITTVQGTDGGAVNPFYVPQWRGVLSGHRRPPAPSWGILVRVRAWGQRAVTGSRPGHAQDLPHVRPPALTGDPAPLQAQVCTPGSSQPPGRRGSDQSHTLRPAWGHDHDPGPSFWGGRQPRSQDAWRCPDPGACGHSAPTHISREMNALLCVPVADSQCHGFSCSERKMTTRRMCKDSDQPLIVFIQVHLVKDAAGIFLFSQFCFS